MNLPHISPGVRNALLIAGAVGIGAVALAACGTDPEEGRTGDNFSNELFKKYDKGQNGATRSGAIDGFLELGTETFRSYNDTDSTCEVGYYYDGDGDGYSDDFQCTVTRHDHYLVTNTADKIARDADVYQNKLNPELSGDGDGLAWEKEISGMIMDKYDVGWKNKDGVVVGARNGKIDSKENDLLDQDYGITMESRVGREFTGSTYTYQLGGEEKTVNSAEEAVKALQAAGKKTGSSEDAASQLAKK